MSVLSRQVSFAILMHSFAISAISVLMAPSMACTAALCTIAQKMTHMSPAAMHLVKMRERV